ncbi:MAG: hypothetical protein HY860_01520 [Chlamydiales bacterium]|nr:hypothetical protein [Chlamydiales bacterium]
MSALRPLKKYIVEGNQQVIAYFKDKIEGETAFSKALLSSINFDQGQFFTLLPENADLHFLYQLQSTQILPQDLVGEIYIESLAQTFCGRWVNSMEEEIVDYLDQYIKKHPSLFYLFDDVLRDYPNDIPKELINHVRSHNQEIYYVVNETTSNKETIKRIIFSSNAIWHMLGVCIDNITLEKLKEPLSSEDVMSLAKNIQFIMTRAYDGAGYLFWEKGKIKH